MFLVGQKNNTSMDSKRCVMLWYDCESHGLKCLFKCRGSRASSSGHAGHSASSVAMQGRGLLRAQGVQSGSAALLGLVRPQPAGHGGGAGSRGRGQLGQHGGRQEDAAHHGGAGGERHSTADSLFSRRVTQQDLLKVQRVQYKTARVVFRKLSGRLVVQDGG